MKKKLIFILTVAMLVVCAFAVSACGKPALGTPANLKFNLDEYTVSWDAVENTRRYTVEVNGREYTARTNVYSVSSLEEGEYSVRVKAVSTVDAFSDSKWSESISFTKEHESGMVYRLINNNTEYEVARIGTASKDIVVEEEYRGKPVTRIGVSAFANNGRLESIVIGKNVKEIADRAFYNCTYLTSVTIPDSVTKIGDYAFQSCRSLTELTVPDSVTELGNFAFAYCRGLTSIKISENISVIGERAFSDTQTLQSITIPQSVKSIGAYAFYNSGLTSVHTGDGVETIAPYAFNRCTALESVTIGANTLTIGEYAFATTERATSVLKSVNISDSVESIGEGAFWNDRELDDVQIGSGMKSIARWAFLNTKLYTDVAGENNAVGAVYADKWIVGVTSAEIASNQIVWKEDVAGIADYAFRDCKSLSTVKLPSTVKYIGNYAFSGCSALTGVEFGSGVKTLGTYAFSRCTNLRNVMLNNGLETIEAYAFSGCTALGSRMSVQMTIPASVTKIGTYAFNNTGFWEAATDVVYVDKWLVGCKNKEVVQVIVNDGTVGIADYAFFQCQNLAYVELPSSGSVRIIGRSAFYSCGSLQNLNLTHGIVSIGDYAFYRNYSLLFADIPETVTKIGRSTFYESGVVLIEIPDSVTEIGDYAFYGCQNAVRLILGGGVRTIGNRSFQGCISLESIDIPDNVEYIGAHAFDKCYYLDPESGMEYGVKSITVGNGIKTISDYAFANNGCLTSVTLSAGVTEIGNYAFYRDSRLVGITLGDGLESIGNYAFFGCSSLETIVFPESVKSIGRYAFRNCTALTSVALGSSLESVGMHAFYGCSNLTIYAQEKTLPAGWQVRFNSSYRPVVWGAEPAEGNAYVVSVTVEDGGVSNVTPGKTVSAPVREGYVFAGWTTQEGGTEAEYSAEQIAEVPAGTVLYAIWVPESAEPEPQE